MKDNLWTKEDFAAPLSGDLPAEEQNLSLWKQILALGSPPETEDEDETETKVGRKYEEKKDEDQSRKETAGAGKKVWKRWSGVAVKERVWKVYTEGPPTNNTHFLQTENGRNWRTLCVNVREFCQKNGMPGTFHDPLRNIGHLGDSAFYQMTFIQDLHHKIGKLKDEARSKSRIIAVLSFRHLLESLPPVARAGGQLDESLDDVLGEHLEKSTGP